MKSNSNFWKQDGLNNSNTLKSLEARLNLINGEKIKKQIINKKDQKQNGFKTVKKHHQTSNVIRELKVKWR